MPTDARGRTVDWAWGVGWTIDGCPVTEAVAREALRDVRDVYTRQIDEIRASYLPLDLDYRPSYRGLVG